MKNLIYSLLSGILILCSCSPKKATPKHDAPTFLVVVDSICEKFTDKDSYNASAVKNGMHQYMGYYAANENPILKDLPMTLTGITTANTLDGAKLVSGHFTYNFEEPTENGQRVYSLHLIVENEYGANDSIPLTENESYIIVPDGGLVQYDGMLDVIGINETPEGQIIDGRSFGTLKIKGATFKPVSN